MTEEKDLLNEAEQEVEKEKPAFTLKKGKKKYPVYLHFKNDGEENINSKIKKIIEKTIKKQPYNANC